MLNFDKSQDVSATSKSQPPRYNLTSSKTLKFTHKISYYTCS